VLKTTLEVASAVFGLLGTWLMSRRYAKEFGRSLAYALITPILFLIGRGDRARSFMKEKIKGNRDLPDSAGEMALGLNLLFWAFFLQLVAPFVEHKH